MKPRLVVLNGPLQGTQFILLDETVSIGRHHESALCIPDSRTSRRHCQITKEGERFRLSDLNSSLGTFVNDVSINDHWLEHGDRIRIADSLVWFLLRDEEPSAVVPDELSQDDSISQLTTTLQGGSSRFLTGEINLPEEDDSKRLARDLSVLLRINSSINSIRSSEPLQRQLLEPLCEVLPVRRAVFLVADQTGEGYSPSFVWNRSDETEGPVRVSRTIVDRVVADRMSILSRHVAQDIKLKGSESLIASGVQSVLCVPLMVSDRLIGIIYLETDDSTAPFQESHLHLMTAVAGIGGIALQNAQYLEWLEDDNLRLREDLGIEHNMVGRSPPMQRVYDLIRKVAPTTTSVLICGENGTGKELAARAIHENSPRSEGPFVAINCAALAEQLLESELFGHEKGAFTSAHAQARGKLEVGNGGTVFLDEIGELALPLQAKLLRVLEEREFERVGGTRPIKVDIRLLAATNKALEQEVESGRFRRDLYFRLNVIGLTMPPLREHPEDIPLLAQHFAYRFSAAYNRAVTGISAEARICLMNHDWPGNVRELRNVIERAVVLGSTDVIQLEDLPETMFATAGAAAADGHDFQTAMTEFKKELILKTVREEGGVYKAAANRLGIHPSYLRRLMRSLNLRPESRL